MELVNFENKGLSRHLRSEEDVKSLLNCLVALPAYIGAKSFSSIENKNEREQTVIILANFIMKRFPAMNVERLVDAFEMTAAGELFANGQALKVTTYNKMINIDLIGQICQAYKLHLERERTRPKPIDWNQKQLPEAKRDDEFHYRELKEYVQENKKLPKLRFWKQIFKYLVRTEQVEPLKKVKRFNSNHSLKLDCLLEGSETKKQKSAIKKHFIALGLIEAPDPTKPAGTENLECSCGSVKHAKAEFCPKCIAKKMTAESVSNALEGLPIPAGQKKRIRKKK